MFDDRTETLADALTTITDKPANAWVYLPIGEDWRLASRSVTLVSGEVPPEDEDLPDAGVPEFAKQNGLTRAIDVPTLQDVVSNALSQRPSAMPEDLLRAFIFYHRQDAFIEF
ncbi:MAG: hypothetical protein ACK4GG_09820 [Sphingomonas sp.]